MCVDGWGVKGAGRKERGVGNGGHDGGRHARTHPFSRPSSAPFRRPVARRQPRAMRGKRINIFSRMRRRI